MDNFGESSRSSSGFHRRMQHPTMAGGSSAAMHRTEPDPTMAPELICGCQRTVVAQTARTDKNWGRRFLSCTPCHLFIWEDLLNRYAEDMVFYCQAPVIDELKAELNHARQSLMQKDALIASLESELMKYSGPSDDVDRSTQHNVFIIDPSSGSSDDDIVVMMHSGMINLVQDSLKSTVSNLFNGWDLYFDAFEKVVVRISQNPCKSFDSGFFTLYCIKNFNGDNNIHINEAAIIKFKHYLLYELFGLKENRGFLPAVYVQTIDD